MRQAREVQNEKGGFNGSSAKYNFVREVMINKIDLKSIRLLLDALRNQVILYSN